MDMIDIINLIKSKMSENSKVRMRANDYSKQVKYANAQNDALYYANKIIVQAIEDVDFKIAEIMLQITTFEKYPTENENQGYMDGLNDVIKYLKRLKGCRDETKVIVNSSEETIDLAKKIASSLVTGTVLTLEGALAAGKTTFTKGIALGLGIEDVIDSPTFAIVKEYEGRIPLFHMDVYRLDGDSDVEFIHEYFDRNGVCVIEWASIIAEELPDERIDVKIEHLGGDCREIIISGDEEALKHVNFSN